MTYLSDKYLNREIDYSRAPVNPSALIVIRHRTGFTLAYDDGKPALCGIRENAPETARQAWVDDAKAKRLAVLSMNAPSAFHFEPGADGKPQAVLPGAERTTSAHIARNRSAAPLRPRKPQKPCDVGLFSDAADQLDLVEMFQDPAED